MATLSELREKMKQAGMVIEPGKSVLNSGSDAYGSSNNKALPSHETGTGNNNNEGDELDQNQLSNSLTGFAGEHSSADNSGNQAIKSEQLESIQINPAPKIEIKLNQKQALANSLILAGHSICLIGAAGTGKTTTMKVTTRQLITSGHIPKITAGTKWLKPGAFGVVILGFTRKAVNNIRRSVVDELKEHTLTIHKLLEFAPVKYELEDKETGGMKMSMKFEPQRNQDNPLPPELKVIIWEESSMIGTELYNQFKAALCHEVQEIFLGDIQQLPPVFGSAVLGFKMIEFADAGHVVELTEVYRQALDSPILSMAWDILRGDANKFSGKIERYLAPTEKNPKATRLRCPALDAYNISSPEYGETKFQYWQSATTEHNALLATTMLFKNWATDGYYDPEEDIILCPFNKSFGTVEINKHLSQHFGILRGATVHEIICGFERTYLAVGDRVLYDKEDAFIENISPNPAYLGKTNYATASIHLDRWGIKQAGPTEQEELQAMAEGSKLGEDQVDYFLEGGDSLSEIDERVNAASHLVTVRISHSDEVITLQKAGDIGPGSLLGGYCITVHKAQGSEWDKVFLWLHHSHIKMCSRELLYTAVTRARKYLHIMCETSTFEKGVKSQRIKGNTLKEKAIAFEGKLTESGFENPSKSVDLDVEELRRKYSHDHVDKSVDTSVQVSGMHKVSSTSDVRNEISSDDAEKQEAEKPKAVPATQPKTQMQIMLERLKRMKEQKSRTIGTGDI